MPEITAKPAVVTPEMEKQVKAILGKIQAEKKAAATPKEPDWAHMTEQDAYRQDINIEVIEHDIPDYMNMKLKDPEYEVVWANRDQRRIGQLQAEGYEFLKPEHVHPEFKLPLLFDSEHMYIYADVICMRVHKRILYGKRRKGLEVSRRQLGNNRRPPRAREKGTFDIPDVPSIDFGSYYDPAVA